VGDKCVGAYIDGELSRLNAQIPNGATVKIVTDEDATPHSIWLNYVITAKARSSIRNWINKRKSHEFVALGKNIIDKTLKKFGASIEAINAKNMTHTLSALNLNNENALFSSIAKGNQSSMLVAKRLLNDDSLALIEEDDDQILLIKGTEGLAVHLQECCHPVPYDAIVAQLDEHRGLEVHRTNCPTLSHSKQAQKKETISIAWVDDTNNESYFLAPLNVQVQNRVGVLSHITDFLEKMQVNIEDINISGDSTVKDMYFLLQVRNANHLRQIAESLNNQSHIINVVRLFDKAK
jgi:(p)ppGpp synthase/HD superfamily hydrolase